MNRLTDKALLLLYTLGSCLLIQPDPVYIWFFFLAVAFSAFSEFLQNKLFLLPGLAVYGLVTLAFPQGVFFYPLLAYDYFSAELFSSRRLWSLVPLGIVFFPEALVPGPFGNPVLFPGLRIFFFCDLLSSDGNVSGGTFMVPKRLL